MWWSPFVFSQLRYCFYVKLNFFPWGIREISCKNSQDALNTKNSQNPAQKILLSQYHLDSLGNMKMSNTNYCFGEHKIF